MPVRKPTNGPRKRRVNVTRKNIEAWLRAVPRFPDPDSPTARRYIQQWNVREKIARAKLNGQWPAILNEP